MGHRRLLLTLTAGSVIALGLGGVAPAALAASAASARPHAAGQITGAGARAAAAGVKNNPFCQRLAAKRIQASSGANMFCFGAQLHQGSTARPAQIFAPAAPANVDAASPAEDVSPAGVAMQGQSEVSVGAVGQYVVEAWNDATGFTSACGAPKFKEEGTGLGFSVNGGRSFRDLGGLRNPDCANNLYEGDPSVQAYRVGGHDYFYISSLYDPPTGVGPSMIAFDACKVTGSGTAARLACGRPIIAGSSTTCLPATPTSPEFCSFTDKEYLTIDPARGRLYVTYSDFVLTGSGGNPIVMSVCDLGSRTGGRGPAGGTPAAPVCKTGTPLQQVSPTLLQGRPYFTVAKPDPIGCENEGAYPAADVASGGVYVGWEYNWGSSLGFPACETASTPVQDVLAKVPPRCLTLTATSPCRHPSFRAAVPVVSMEAVFVPGYNRFPASDFPRLAVSDRFNAVSMVWNDARHHPYGDILLKSFGLVALHPVQARPLVLDRPHGGGLSFLPALRTANARGLLDVSWYTRSSVATVDTGVNAALNVNPRASVTPANARITNRLSDWLANSSAIIPNFGDYTDAAVAVTGSPPFLGTTLFIAWSDGRLGIPQPFEAHLPAG